MGCLFSSSEVDDSKERYYVHNYSNSFEKNPRPSVSSSHGTSYAPYDPHPLRYPVIQKTAPRSTPVIPKTTTRSSRNILKTVPRTYATIASSPAQAHSSSVVPKKPTQKLSDQRCFGHYECHKCGRTWKSAFSWEVNSGQKCKHCNTMIRPYDQEDLLAGKSHEDPEKHHEVTLCEQCKFLGHPCTLRRLKVIQLT